MESSNSCSMGSSTFWRFHMKSILNTWPKEQRSSRPIKKCILQQEKHKEKKRRVRKTKKEHNWKQAYRAKKEEQNISNSGQDLDGEVIDNEEPAVRRAFGFLCWWILTFDQPATNPDLDADLEQARQQLLHSHLEPKSLSNEGEAHPDKSVKSCPYWQKPGLCAHIVAAVWAEGFEHTKKHPSVVIHWLWTTHSETRLFNKPHESTLGRLVCFRCQWANPLEQCCCCMWSKGGVSWRNQSVT